MRGYSNNLVDGLVPLSNAAPSWAYDIRFLYRDLTTPKRAERNSPLFTSIPYCLHPMSKQHHRCLVNREYKPIGYSVSEPYAVYEMFPVAHISVIDFNRLKTLGIVCDYGYLYTDTTDPRRSKRLLTEYRNKLAAMIEPYVVPLVTP